MTDGHGTVYLDTGWVSYSVSDQIAESEERRKRWDSDPEFRQQFTKIGFTEPPVPLTLDDAYPKTERYTFQEFAGPVFEMGGYGDITMIDPYTLKRLWIADALGNAEHPRSIYDAMRLAIEVAEKVGFPNATWKRDEPAETTSAE